MPSDLSVAHKQAQADLAARTALVLQAVWSLLDPDDLDGTFEAWLAACTPIVTAQHSQSARLAAGYLTAYKKITHGGVPPIDLEDLNLDALSTSLMVTGPVSVKSAVHRGDPLDHAMDVAMYASAAAGSRHALDGGRGLISRSIAADRDARGYQRVTGGNACTYCANKAGVTFPTDEVFPAHDGCACGAEPVYR